MESRWHNFEPHGDDHDSIEKGRGSFATTLFKGLLQFIAIFIFYIYLLDYFQISMLASLRRSSSRGHDIVSVESLMGSFVLAGLMERPVLVEVLAGAQGAQPQYSLGTGQSPAGAGYRHTVLYQVPTGALDDSCGDGQPLGKVAMPAFPRRISRRRCRTQFSNSGPDAG